MKKHNTPTIAMSNCLFSPISENPRGFSAWCVLAKFSAKPRNYSIAETVVANTKKGKFELFRKNEEN